MPTVKSTNKTEASSEKNEALVNLNISNKLLSQDNYVKLMKNRRDKINLNIKLFNYYKTNKKESDFKKLIESFDEISNQLPYTANLTKAKCYLDRYYFELANLQNRKTKQDLENQNFEILKQNAKQAFEKARENISVEQNIFYRKEDRETQIDTYLGLLNNEKVDLSLKTIDDYKKELNKLYKNKIINIDTLCQIELGLNYNLFKANKDFNKLRKEKEFPLPLISKNLITNYEEFKNKNNFKNARFDKNFDYSICVTDLNKMLETTLTSVFLTEYNKFKKNVLYKQNNPEFKQKQDFKLGNLFNLTYQDFNIDENNKKNTIKQEDKDIFKFMVYINENYRDKEKLRLKFIEFVNKIELYRIIIRNTSAHKEKLTKEALEEGLNLMFFQDNSIIDLMIDLFKDYFNKVNNKKLTKTENIEIQEN